MKKAILNKNIHHNGKAYAKGSVVIDQSLAAQLINSGHADVMEDSGPMEMPVAVIAEEKSVEPAKPAKSKKFKA